VGIKGVRDCVVINGGAIIPRCAIAPKREIGVIYARRLVELGCPILYTVHGKGCFEGGNVVWLDSKHVLVGISTRTNMEGLSQVEPIFRMAGVEQIRPVHLPGYLSMKPSKRVGGPAGFFHLDMVFSMVDEGLGVIYPPGMDYDSLRYIQKKGIKLIEAPLEEVQDYGCNILALEPGKVIIPAGSSYIIEKLLKENVEVIPLEMPELRAGGGPICNTLPLIREPGPSI
jgi:N-dimethylarginine dimethylaminohydrolase